jgi:hypothetical protein
VRVHVGPAELPFHNDQGLTGNSILDSRSARTSRTGATTEKFVVILAICSYSACTIRDQQ